MPVPFRATARPSRRSLTQQTRRPVNTRRGYGLPSERHVRVQRLSADVYDTQTGRVEQSRPQ
ncbi:hypothetical protein, partial [Streptomyces sp. NPDC054837]